ncbi:FIST N-terminal domain-containing protein [Kitasatospora sp. NPDC048540]|uniref:FIST signal transduction protein n=1 Tax=unclassified Kitasatospora TaxID=2633591 RepID=UPI00053B1B52|nr:FIST N-terminal domain-containing protein [Kitasatospora sp. MBT63]
MTTTFGTGASHLRDAAAAARDAVGQALRNGSIDRPDFVFLFASVGYDQSAIVKAVWEAADRAPLAGCSAEGILVGDQPDESNFCVAVMLAQSDSISFRHGLAPGLKTGSGDVGHALGRQIGPLRPDDRALFLFPDGMTSTVDELLDGLKEQLDGIDRIPILGGTAGDNNLYERSFQYLDGEVVEDAASWAMLSGDARVVPALGHGCVPVGLDFTLTSTEGRTVKEIDGRPAIEVYGEYVGTDELADWQTVVVSLPFGFPVADGVDGYVPYVALSQNKEAGTVNLPVRAPEGTRVRLMRRDIDLLTSNADQIAAYINAELGSATPDLIMQFECAGRGRHYLPESQTRQILKRLHSQLPSVPKIGFYTFGELCPTAGQNRFHHFTCVLAALVCS